MVRALKFKGASGERPTEQESQAHSKGLSPTQRGDPQVRGPSEVIAQSSQWEGFEGLPACSPPQPGLRCSEPKSSDGGFRSRRASFEVGQTWA